MSGSRNWKYQDGKNINAIKAMTVNEQQQKIIKKQINRIKRRCTGKSTNLWILRKYSNEGW